MMTNFRRAHLRMPMLVLAISLLAAAGCRKGITPIKTLLDDPSQYDNHQVRIAGDVIQGAGLLGYGAYQVKDDTGTLTVVSRGGGAPREGAEVAVEGTFRALFTLGPQSGAVLMETKRYTR